MEMKILWYFFPLLLLLPAVCAAQENFDFYISNNGNDTLPGTSMPLAKKTLTASAPWFTNFSVGKKIVKVGLKSGDVFEDNLITSYPIEVNTYDNSVNNDFAVLNGSKEFNTGWLPAAETRYSFSQLIPYKGFSGYGINGIGSYSFIYVTEIDRTLEKTAPFTARKILKFVTSPAAVESTPGSFYTPINTNENPMPVLIHTSDGTPPNTNVKFRYEVTVRDWGINSTYQKDNMFENLWVRGFGAGNGMLPGGANSYYNKIIFGPGAAIHHLVVRSGTINNSLFLPGAKNSNVFAVVFYDVEGLGRHCTIRNSMFFDIPQPVYAHTSYGTNYGAVEITNVVAFGDSTDRGGFMYTANTDTATLHNVYTDSYSCGYNYGTAKYASITDCYFKDVSYGIAYSPKNSEQAVIDNVFIKTKGNDNTTGIIMQNGTSLAITNSIIHLASSAVGNWSLSSFVSGCGQLSNKIIATGNIFICDIDPSKGLIAAATNTDLGIATSKDTWDKNVYILLKGQRITWAAINASLIGGSALIGGLDEWKRQSGQDKNSLYFDLRNDPRGLRAIFADPDHGNYNLADTKEGNQIAALRAGMTAPLTCFLKKPSYEEAAALVRNNKVLSIDECRSPCTQKSIRVNSTFDAHETNNHEVSLSWNISEQQNIAHYEIERATGNAGFKRIGMAGISADSLYSFTDHVQPGITYSYRLVVVAATGGRCYSAIRAVKTTDTKTFILYPNPSRGKVFISMNGYIGRTTFIVSDLLGRPILTTEIFMVYRPYELDLTNQPRGVYLLTVKTTSGSSVQKISLE